MPTTPLSNRRTTFTSRQLQPDTPVGIKPASAPLHLTHLRGMRLTAKLKRSHLAHLTTISEERITLIETRKVEPWLDEAHRIACVLGIAGINPLVVIDKALKVSGSLTVSEQLSLWRSGERIRLSTAYAVSVDVGIRDPYDLVSTALACEVWNVCEANDRHPTAGGWCPWCGADVHSGQPHARYCLPSVVLARPAYGPMNAERLLPTQDGAAAFMPGRALKALRERLHMTQVEVGEHAGLTGNYYSRLERCEVGLSRANAEKLGQVLGVDPAALYLEVQEDA